MDAEPELEPETEAAEDMEDGPGKAGRIGGAMCGGGFVGVVALALWLASSALLLSVAGVMRGVSVGVDIDDGRDLDIDAGLDVGRGAVAVADACACAGGDGGGGGADVADGAMVDAVDVLEDTGVSVAVLGDVGN